MPGHIQSRQKILRRGIQFFYFFRNIVKKLLVLIFNKERIRARHVAAGKKITMRLEEVEKRTKARAKIIIACPAMLIVVLYFEAYGRYEFRVIFNNKYFWTNAGTK